MRFALENPSRYRMMFGLKARGEVRQEMHEAAHALHERIVRAVAECQEVGELPVGDPVELAALLYATSHGAIPWSSCTCSSPGCAATDPSALVSSVGEVG